MFLILQCFRLCSTVSDDMVYQFILTPPVSEYFSDLVHRLRDLCFRLDAFLYDKGYVHLNFLIR